VNRQLVSKAAFPVVAASLAVVIAACSTAGAANDTDSVTTLAPVQTGEVAIAAGDNTFTPEQVTVAEGSTVTFTNEGRNQHNVIAVADTPFSAETAMFEPGESFRWKASKPGTYQYYCSIHGTATAGMTGTIQVVAP
jgi:plastocyanin